MHPRIFKKLAILADAAKYDVSCASSGSRRRNEGGLGNAEGMGICHTFTPDGRCVSLLKVLYTNYCIFDCAYCVSRRSNDVPRTGFTVEEVVELTMNFYRRNYIEGLFLSSGIFKNADYTMERLVRIVKLLRTQHRFHGYIHLKAIPGTSPELLHEAALYADRLSVNMEMPSRESLRLLAPEKHIDTLLTPMRVLRSGIQQHRDEQRVLKHAPLYAPAGQSTQLVVGATLETDQQVLTASAYFYQKMQMRRVYYSGYVPVGTDARLPALGTPVPIIREHRLYQADWLMRFYGFQVQEVVNEAFPNLEQDIDPKLAWALRNLHLFPVDVNYADLEMLKRVPGLGVQSAQRIVAARRFRRLGVEHLRRLGLAWNRARHFIACADHLPMADLPADRLKSLILTDGQSKYQAGFSSQLSLFHA